MAEGPAPTGRLTLRLTCEPASLGGMRRALRAWLADAGASERLAGELLLACNEASANAIEHAGCSEFEVEAALAADGIRIAVRDSGRWSTPGPVSVRSVPGEPVSGRGRGLALIEALADAEIEPTPTGTVVRMFRPLDGDAAGERPPGSA
jgi:anti-sigma regulatory factor (Ser/Thr protein kinase)